MVCVQDFNQADYLSEEAGVSTELIHKGCFSAASVFFAGVYLHHTDKMAFFDAMSKPEENLCLQGPETGLRPGLEGFSELLGKHGLEWEGQEYDPREFLYTFHRDAFVLCGFYRKEDNRGHALAIFVDTHLASDSIYIFDPNCGLFRGDSGYTLFDHIEYYLLKEYPDIDARRITFRNVRRVVS